MYLHMSVCQGDQCGREGVCVPCDLSHHAFDVTWGYGQQAGGTLPTGMHSCFWTIIAFETLTTCNRIYLCNEKFFWAQKNSIACGWVVFWVWPPTHSNDYNVSCLWLVSLVIHQCHPSPLMSKCHISHSESEWQVSSQLANWRIWLPVLPWHGAFLTVQSYPTHKYKGQRPLSLPHSP